MGIPMSPIPSTSSETAIKFAAFRPAFILCAAMLANLFCWESCIAQNPTYFTSVAIRSEGKMGLGLPFNPEHDGNNGDVILGWQSGALEAQGTYGLWSIIPLAGVDQGFVRIENVATGLCLDAHKDDVAKEGCLVQTWTWIGGDNQKWRIRDLGSGMVGIQLKQSGLSLALWTNGENYVPRLQARPERLMLTPVVSRWPRYFRQREGEMYAEASLTEAGLLTCERFAGIKFRSGTAKHEFTWVCMDVNGQPLWRSPTETLTIGAPFDGSYRSKRETMAYQIRPDVAARTAYVICHMKRNKSGAWDGNPEPIEKWIDIGRKAVDIFK